uniref:Uncharacterized protein n=1 Tax=Anopheles maculatus TaxID=74869 RepID=A0A182T3M2_9DIPT
MTIDDLIEMIDEDDAANKNKLPIQEEAYECSDDDDDEEKNSDKFDALQKQVTTALQERTATWKRNGLEQICNSDFSLSVDFVQKWMKECELGTGKQVSKERETRFTEYNGKTQIDVTHRENVSVLHETERKQLTAEHSADYEFNGHDQRRVVVHQVEKTTISSYLTVDPNVSNEAMLQLPLDSFFGNITCYTPFKIPAAIEQFRNSCRDNRKVQQQIPRKINIGSSGSGTLSYVLENSLKLVPISRVEDVLQKKPQSRAPRVRFKPTKKMQFRRRAIETSSSSEQSSSSDSSSRSESSEKSACSGEKNKKH